MLALPTLIGGPTSVGFQFKIIYYNLYENAFCLIFKFLSYSNVFNLIVSTPPPLTVL